MVNWQSRPRHGNVSRPLQATVVSVSPRLGLVSDAQVAVPQVAKAPQPAHMEDTPMQTNTITLRELTIRYSVKADATGQPFVIGRTLSTPAWELPGW